MTDVTATSGSSVLNKIDDSRTRLASNTETFLKLLTTQMKNQDPLSPMDSTQFTQQIVQMTGVEQQLLTNDLLAALVGMSDGGLAGSVNLIGKTVTAETDAATLADGQATWNFNLPRAAASLQLEVVNSSGVTVRTETLTGQNAGDQSFTWDGKSDSGATLADGAYTLKLTALDASGARMTPTQTMTGLASAVQSVNGTTVVTIGKAKVPISAITSVSNTV
ncbi:MAG: flagellar hook assembly protein FlgD [Caulobacter sp.]|nr:flagellar hook assembly protein FlgD [Caulobacter sp.]